MRDRIGKWRSRVSEATKSYLFSGLTKSGQLVAALVLLTLGVFLTWVFPRQAAQSLPKGTSAVERHQVEDMHRATGAQIFLGIVVFVGAWSTLRRVRAAERQAESAARQAETAEQGQITERFTRAIEQLGRSGDETLAIRLGGVYALERVMRDSAKDFPSVRDVLGAFVRHETTKAENDESEPVLRRFKKPRTDIQAALTVLARNSPEPGVELTEST